MTLRRVRLRAVWVIVLPFLWLARPTALLLVTGALIVCAGLALRGWAAGVLEKDRGLTTTGPYAITRNPLYLGSLVIGLGVTVAGGHWVWPLVFVLFYTSVYVPTIRAEGRALETALGDEYRGYAATVPVYLPRLGRRRFSPRSDGARFSWRRYVRNREWEAALGAIAAFAVLAARLV